MFPRQLSNFKFGAHPSRVLENMLMTQHVILNCHEKTHSCQTLVWWRQTKLKNSTIALCSIARGLYSHLFQLTKGPADSRTASLHENGEKVSGLIWGMLVFQHILTPLRPNKLSIRFLHHPRKIIYVHNRHLCCYRFLCSKCSKWFVSSLIISLAKPKSIQLSQWKSLVCMFYEPQDVEAIWNTGVISYLDVEQVLFMRHWAAFIGRNVSPPLTLYSIPIEGPSSHYANLLLMQTLLHYIILHLTSSFAPVMITTATNLHMYKLLPQMTYTIVCLVISIHRFIRMSTHPAGTPYKSGSKTDS